MLSTHQLLSAVALDALLPLRWEFSLFEETLAMGFCASFSAASSYTLSKFWEVQLSSANNQRLFCIWTDCLIKPRLVPLKKKHQPEFKAERGPVGPSLLTQVSFSAQNGPELAPSKTQHWEGRHSAFARKHRFCFELLKETNELFWIESQISSGQSTLKSLQGNGKYICSLVPF